MHDEHERDSFRRVISKQNFEKTVDIGSLVQKGAKFHHSINFAKYPLSEDHTMMPFSKRTYSFREKNTENSEPKKQALTPLRSFRKIKSRGRTNQIPIGSTTPKDENTQEATTPFTRGSVRLKSIRKRKMAAPMFDQVDGTSNKREKMADKDKDEIELKIEENIKMRDGIMKLITGCHDTRQAMEIGKNLLTINSRMLSLMSSLQKKRSSIILKDHNKQSGSDIKSSLEPCLADVAISDIRIPLMWRSDAHFKTKAGEQSALLYHMFCLLKINDQVFDTPLVKFSEIDTDVTFDSVFTFQNVSSDFKLEIEAYYSVMQNPDNPAWTPMRTPKKSTYSSVPKYCLAAHAQLTNHNIQDGFSVSDFVMGGIGASATAVLGHVDDFPDNPLALWGQFSCQLRATPMCMKKDSVDGCFHIQTANGGQPVWEKYFCRLRHCVIEGWKQFPEKGENFTMTPGLSIRMKKGMKIRVEKSQELNRNIMILTTRNSEEKEPVFSFENEDDLRRWERELQQAIVNAKAWKYACETFMDIDEFQAKKTAYSKAMNFYDHAFTVNGNDARQISPVIPKRGARTTSKSSIISLDAPPKVRSFYDQIDIAMEKTVTNTDEKVSDDVVTPEEKESKTNYLENEVRIGSETQHDKEVNVDNGGHLDKDAGEKLEADEPMETDVVQSDVSTTDASETIAAEKQVVETADDASCVEISVKTESDAVEKDENGGFKDASHEATGSESELNQKKGTEESVEKQGNAYLQVEASDEQADKTDEGAYKSGEQVDDLGDVSDALQELEDVLSTEIDFSISESDESRVASPEAEEKGQGDEAGAIVSEASESADLEVEIGEKGSTDQEFEGHQANQEATNVCEVVSSTEIEECLTEQPEDIGPVEDIKEGDVSDINDEQIVTQEDNIQPENNTVVTSDAKIGEATVVGIDNDQSCAGKVATVSEKDDVRSQEDDFSMQDSSVSNQGENDSVQEDKSLNEADTSEIDSKLAEEVSNLEDVSGVQENSITKRVNDIAVPEILNSTEAAADKDSSMQEDKDSKQELEDSSPEDEVSKPDAGDSKPENVDSEVKESLIPKNDSTKPGLDDCEKTENYSNSELEQEDCTLEAEANKETGSLNLKEETANTNSEANVNVETDV